MPVKRSRLGASCMTASASGSPRDAAPTLTLTRAPFDALLPVLPWKNIGEARVITLL
jgi:hypothetical protein